MFLKVLSRVSCWSVAHISWVISRLYSELLQQTILVSMLDTPLRHSPGSDNITFIFIAWKKTPKTSSKYLHSTQCSFIGKASVSTCIFWMLFFWHSELLNATFVFSFAGYFYFFFLPLPPSSFSSFSLPPSYTISSLLFFLCTNPFLFWRLENITKICGDILFVG